jgi:hypothetical protein
MTHVEQPMAGDVVVRMAGRGAKPAYLVRTVPGPDQLGCAARAATERFALGYAKLGGVNVWFQEETGGFTLIAQFRKPAFEQPNTAGGLAWGHATTAASVPHETANPRSRIAQRAT